MERNSKNYYFIIRGEKAKKAKKGAEEFCERTKLLCKNTKKIITKEKRLPDNINFLITTSKYKEGINLENTDIPFVFCESHDFSDIIQYMGRVRKGVERFTIMNGVYQHNSKIDANEYEISKNHFVNTFNQYFEKITDKHEKENYITCVENKFFYIRFNYIENEFGICDLKYSRQKTLSNIKKFEFESKAMINKFIKKHDIALEDREELFATSDEKNYQEAVTTSLAFDTLMKTYLNKWLWGSEWIVCVYYINQAFNYNGKTKYKRPCDLKRILTPYGYTLSNKQGNKTEGTQGKTKYMLVKTPKEK